MKNLIIKLSLIAALVVACNTATAFTDNTELQVLMHCDATNQAAVWLTSPDDNSSGRAAMIPLLNSGIMWPPFEVAPSAPVMMPGSPAGGSYFNFDGVDDSIVFDPGWLGGDSVVCDFTFRYRSLPSSGDLYTSLVACDAFTCFISQDGGTPHISLMVQVNYMINSPITLDSNTWYDVSVSIVNDDVSITVNGSTYTEHSPAAFPDITSPMAAGYYLRSGNRYLDGDMDEIRIGNVPEPFTFGLIALLGLLIIRKK